MKRYFLIFTISAVITGQSNGLQNIGNGWFINSPYQSQESRNNYVDFNNERRRIINYIVKEGNELNSDEDRLGGNLDVVRYNRRMFEWLSRFFKTTTPENTQTTTTIESSYAKELKERIFLKALHRNLTDMMLKLSEVQKRVANAMKHKEAHSILTKGKPEIVLNKAYYRNNRFKRDITDNIKTEDTKFNDTNKFDNVTKNTVNVITNITECPCEVNVTNGRRSGSILPPPTEVKSKLLLYLQDSFREIKEKVESLKNLKQMFADNVSFKIGYILANIDTLEINLYNIKNNMDKNKEYLEDSKILELYDTLRVSNQAVSGLVEILKVYIANLNQGQGNNEMAFG